MATWNQQKSHNKMAHTGLQRLRSSIWHPQNLPCTSLSHKTVQSPTCHQGDD